MTPRLTAEIDTFEPAVLTQGVDGRGVVQDHYGQVFAVFSTPSCAYAAMRNAELAVWLFFNPPQGA